MTVNFIIPGNIDTPSGGYRYDKIILEKWSLDKVDYHLTSLQGGFPFPNNEEIENSMMQIDTMPEFKVAVVDGLAGGAMPEFMRVLKMRAPLAALIHHPLCLENGLEEKLAKALKKSEREGLDHVDHVIVTSPATKKTVTELFDYNPDNITTILPGVARGAQNGFEDKETINLLCVASIIPRKGHSFLIEALAGLSHLDWRLDLVGMTDIDPELFENLRQQVDDAGLSDRCTFHGTVDETQLDAFYAAADVFVLPSLYEGYGMAYAEAIVRGIPVIGTTAGAIPDTVPAVCGILVPPNTVDELQDALRLMISSQETRYEYHTGCLKLADDFPTWENSAKQFSDLLERLI